MASWLPPDVHSAILDWLEAATAAAAVSHAWSSAVRSKRREWPALQRVGTLGLGAGRLRGELDVPTALCLLPSGRVLCVDSCNLRLSSFAPDGSACDTMGQPGSGAGQSSAPCSVACDVESGAVFAACSVYSASGRPQGSRILRLRDEGGRLIVLSSTAVPIDALTGCGLAAAAGRVFVVHSHQLLSFCADTMAPLARCPPPPRARARTLRRSVAAAAPFSVFALSDVPVELSRRRYSCWLIITIAAHCDRYGGYGARDGCLNCPSDVISHRGEIFICDSHK
eukprot:5786338-Prymnesium_polylepis.1